MADRVSEMTSKYIPKEHAVNRASTATAACNNNPIIGGPSRTKQADQAVMTHINPYMTTTKKDHRPFTTTEQGRAYAKKNALTFWEFENYPKVWGHGSRDGANIPPRRQLNKNDSMRDLTMGGLEIKSETTKIPARPSAIHVPNKGLNLINLKNYFNFFRFKITRPVQLHPAPGRPTVRSDRCRATATLCRLLQSRSGAQCRYVQLSIDVHD